MSPDSPPRTILLRDFVFDPVQLRFVVRRLPLAPGFATTLALFEPQLPGGTVTADVRVVGREPVTVPAGTFECYKVEIVLGPAERGRQTLWISADAARYLVQIDEAGLLPGGMRRAELTAIERREPGTGATFHDDVHRLTFVGPPGWLVTSSTNITYINWTNRPSTQVETLAGGALSLEDSSQCVLVVDPWRPSITPQTPLTLAQEDLKRRSPFDPAFVVRDDSWAPATVSGLPAVQFIADYIDKERGEMVAYGTYAAEGERRVFITCRAPRSAFAAARPAMDAMIDSIRRE
jgi:hypothetical protein